MGRKRTRPIKEPVYKFKKGETAIYKGHAYENYTDQVCTVIERSKIYYKVEFKDGKSFETIPFVLEKEKTE